MIVKEFVHYAVAELLIFIFYPMFCFAFILDANINNNFV